MTSFSKIQAAGISICHDFAPGDLGWLIYIHGIQNFADYGYNHVHEAYCARIAVEFILGADKGRSRAWLAKKQGKVVGSIFIVERPNKRNSGCCLWIAPCAELDWADGLWRSPSATAGPVNSMAFTFGRCKDSIGLFRSMNPSVSPRSQKRVSRNGGKAALNSALI